MTSRHRALRVIERVSFALGVLCLGVYFTAKAEALLFERRQAVQIERFQPPRFEAAPPLRGIAVAQESWGRIEVPRLDLRAFLSEGVDAKTLRVAVGHIPSTAFPDEPGNVALAAHRDSLFRPLRDLVVGDLITLHTPSGVFEYNVESIDVVSPSRVDLVAPSPGQVLTLVTCYPFDFLGPAPLRFVARARLTFSPVAKINALD